jgi:copper transport protein
MAAHGVVIAFWVGSLWPLLRLLRTQDTGAAATIVMRFSRLAVIAVAVLVATGLILATLQLGGDVTALVATPYGQLLLIKLGVVALLLLLAIYNKFRLTPALTDGAPDAVGRLSRAIRLEIAAVGLILAVTALLGQSPPPRALAAMTAPTAAAQTVTAQARGYTASVAVTPGRTGRNTITIALTAPDGAPFTPLEAKAEISLPEQGIEPLSEPLSITAPGRYQWVMNGFVRPGAWQLKLTILINDFESASFELPLKIGE